MLAYKLRQCGHVLCEVATQSLFETGQGELLILTVIATSCGAWGMSKGDWGGIC